jgi:hypothetical protein
VFVPHHREIQEQLALAVLVLDHEAERLGAGTWPAGDDAIEADAPR